jgi:putative drug exporter of the RND superfamily
MEVHDVPMTLSPRRLSRASARHPKRTLAIWGAVLLVAIASIATLMAGALTAEVRFLGNPESERAAAILEQRLGTQDHPVETLVIEADDGVLSTAARRDAITTAVRDIGAIEKDKVLSVTSPVGPEGARLVSNDANTAIIPVTLAGDAKTAQDNVAPVLDVADGLSGTEGLSVTVTGRGAIDTDQNATAERDLLIGEAIGIPIALLIMLFVFGSVVSALVPLALAMTSIITALGLTAAIGTGYQLSFFVTNMITMMGLAVGIDYALFIVSRYRDERAAGTDTLTAIETSTGTAGRAVTYSGITVVVALVGLLLVPNNIFLSLGIGAVLVVLVAVLASMTLLPAVMAALGDRFDAARIPFLRRTGGEGRVWARIADAVMRRPGTALVIAAAALIIATIPLAGINTGSAGVGNLPSDSSSRQAYETLGREFDAGAVAPAVIALEGEVRSPQGQKAIGDLRTALAGDARFGEGQLEQSDAGDAAVLTVPVRAEATSLAARGAVSDLRSDILPAAFSGSGIETAVAGQTAETLDFVDITNRYLPIVVGLVLVLSFIVLLIAFRSVVIPITAILMNLLSVGVAYGLLVLVFQDGVGAGLLGFQQVDTIEAWLPLFLFAVLFGLSMDYHVFLLSRIRERYEATGDTAVSVRDGIASSGRLITGAALIMVAVFSGFAAGQLVMFQQMGFGLAVAVLIDATIVRSILVPATMRLLGARNWYLPKFLQWLPRVDVEGSRGGEAVRLPA